MYILYKIVFFALLHYRRSQVRISLAFRTLKSAILVEKAKKATNFMAHKVTSITSLFISSLYDIDFFSSYS